MTAPQRSTQQQQVMWRVVGLGTGLIAGEVTRWALTIAWEKVRGDEPPRDPAAPGIDRAAALRWAIASGAAVAVSQLVARRVSARAWQAVTGSLPPGEVEAIV